MKFFLTIYLPGDSVRTMETPRTYNVHIQNVEQLKTDFQTLDERLETNNQKLPKHIRQFVSQYVSQCDTYLQWANENQNDITASFQPQQSSGKSGGNA